MVRTQAHKEPLVERVESRRRPLNTAAHCLFYVRVVPHRPFHPRHALDARTLQAALECLLDEKAELATHAAELQTRLREAEAVAAAASRATVLPAEEGVGLEPGDLAARPGRTADQRAGSHGAAGTATANVGGHSPGSTEDAGGAEAETTTQQDHRRQPTLPLLRRAEVAASQSRAEVDHLRGELERVRAEQALAAAAAAKEREMSERRVSELKAAVEQTKREYRDHRDKAESRLETLRVAFDEENEENDTQVK